MLEGAEEIDFEARRLCPDGSCIGVLDEKGRCGVCAVEGPGTEAEPVDVAAGTAAVAEPVAAPVGESESVAETDDEDRELCPDGACIGLIGADGKCKVCGQPRAQY